MSSAMPRTLALIALGVLLSACSEFYSIAPRSLIKTAGNFSIISAGVVMASDKTLTDHLISFNSGKNCSTVRLEQGRTYCREDEPNPIPAMHCYRTLGDVMCYAAPEASRQPGDEIGTLKPVEPKKPFAYPL